MKKKNGFTLMELVGVVILLSLIALIAIPSIIAVIRQNQEKLHKEQVGLIEAAAKNWAMDNLNQLDKIQPNFVDVDFLVLNGYIEQSSVLNPQTKEEMAGCVMVRYETNKYKYEYLPECKREQYLNHLQITDNYPGDWTKEVKAVVSAKYLGESGSISYKYCIGDSECEPNVPEDVTEKEYTIRREGNSTFICAQAVTSDEVLSEVICKGPYKIDNTPPVVTIPGDEELDSTVLTYDLNAGFTYSDNLTPTSRLTTVRSGTLSLGTLGVYTIRYRVTDLAGNQTTKTRTITVVDVTPPTITLVLNGNPFNVSGWSKANISAKIEVYDTGGSGPKRYTYCTSTTGNCVPSTNVEKTVDDITISGESATNYVCARGFDGAGNQSGVTCLGPYKIDKSIPTCSITLSGTLGTNDWYTTNVTVGLTRNDTLSGISKYGLSTSTTETYNTTETITHTGDTASVTYRGYVEDEAGNKGTCTRTFKKSAAKPTITIAVSGSPFNANNWASANFNMNVTTSDATSGVGSFKHCTTTTGTTCTPSTTVSSNSGTISVSSEGRAVYVCGYSTNNAGVNGDTSCSGPYSLDKTSPTLNVPANGSISASQNTIDLDAGVTYSDNLSTNSELTYSKTGSISLGIIGTYSVTYKVTDQAGNYIEKTRQITVINDVPPVVTLSLSGSPFNGNGWAKANFNINLTSSSTFGTVTSYAYCQTTSSTTCTPGTTGSGSTATIPVSTENAANYVCATVTDSDSNVSTRQCVGPYKLDKTQPSLTVPGDINLTTEDITVNVMTGVSGSDTLSGFDRVDSSGSVSLGIVGTYPITYTAYDNAGNTRTGTRNVIITQAASPTINITVSGSPFNSNNWAKANITMNVSTSASGVGTISSYTYCQTTSSTTCTPGTTVNATSGTITISAESAANYICGYSTRSTGTNSSTVCVGPYKLDKTQPSLTVPGDINLTTEDTTVNVMTGVTGSDTLSGFDRVDSSGTVSLGIAGTYSITYTAYDNAGNTRTGSRNVIITDVPTLMLETLPGSNTSVFLNGPLTRGEIASVTTVNSNLVPGDAIDSWDVGSTKNGSVMAWYKNAGSGKYDVWIGQNGGVRANPNSASLFAFMNSATSINLTHFNTSNVTNMSALFHNATNLSSLNISNFNTSKVTNMSSMFSFVLASNSPLSNLDLSHFDTSKVNNMQGMFANRKNISSLNTTGWNTSSVTNMQQMFINWDATNLNLSHWNTSNVTNMSNMFVGATINNLNIGGSFSTAKVQDFSFMFQNSNIGNLNLSNFNTSNATNMTAMFSYLRNTPELNLSSFITTKVTNMSRMFEGNSSTTPSSVTCINLKAADFSTVSTYTDMFTNRNANLTVVVKDSTASTWINARSSGINIKIGGECPVAVTLNNLATNGSFESGIAPYAYGNLTTSTSDKVFGSTSAYTPSSQTWPLYFFINTVDDNVYYTSIHIKMNNSLSIGTHLSMNASGPGTNTTLTPFAWTRCTTRFTQTAGGSQNFQTILNGAAGSEMYFDGMMIINLTAAFGAGKEPTKAQMDAILDNNGGYWDGNKTIMW